MSKHGDKHEDRTALFPSPRHLIRGLVGSGFMKKINWGKINKLKLFYIVGFLISAYLSQYLYESLENGVAVTWSNTFTWVPFLFAVVGYIHVKWFHNI